MQNVINTSLSGLQAAGNRLQVSANNVANQHSTSSRVNGQTVGEAYQAQEVQQQAVQAGGVHSEVRTKTPATVSYFDPDNSAANADGLTEYPNVNLEEEVISQQIAGYDFKANLSVIRTADEMLGNLIDATA